jgi:plasmid stabilization system protein ParE
MRLLLHPKVYSDISSIMEYYEKLSTIELADEFYRELRHFIEKAVERPESFATRERDLRRVNLFSVPYHFCFASPAIQFGSGCRHHGRHPSLSRCR